jgi:hypothetical protein
VVCFLVWNEVRIIQIELETGSGRRRCNAFYQLQNSKCPRRQRTCSRDCFSNASQWDITADSRDRLEYIAERRTKLMMVLYFLAFVLVAAKLILFIYDEKWHHYLTPVLLVVTGMSAVMTAYYVNQNSRSLIHRYNAQGRSIEVWLLSFNERFFNRLSSQKLDTGVKKNMRDQILVFEKTMTDELIDWTHITGHDAIELAP